MQDQASRQHHHHHRHRHPPHPGLGAPHLGQAQPGLKAHQAANNAASNGDGVANGLQTCGVGLRFAQDESIGVTRIFVQGTVPGGPAEKSGRVKRGDLLVTVDGKEVYGEDLEQVARWIVGPDGVDVRLGFASADKSYTECVLTRALPVDSNVTLQRVDVLETLPDVPQAPSSNKSVSFVIPSSKEEAHRVEFPRAEDGVMRQPLDPPPQMPLFPRQAVWTQERTGSQKSASSLREPATFWDDHAKMESHIEEAQRRMVHNQAAAQRPQMPPEGEREQGSGRERAGETTLLLSPRIPHSVQKIDAPKPATPLPTRRESTPATTLGDDHAKMESHIEEAHWRTVHNQAAAQRPQMPPEGERELGSGRERAGETNLLLSPRIPHSAQKIDAPKPATPLPTRRESTPAPTYDSFHFLSTSSVDTVHANAHAHAHAHAAYAHARTQHDQRAAAAPPRKIVPQGDELQAFIPRRAEVREPKSLQSTAGAPTSISSRPPEAHRTSPRHSPPGPGTNLAHRIPEHAHSGALASPPGRNGALPASRQPERVQSPPQRPQQTVGALQAYPPRRVGAYAEDTSQQQSAITQHMLASVGILADDTPVVGVVHPALARTIDTRPPAAPERSPEKPQAQLAVLSQLKALFPAVDVVRIREMLREEDGDGQATCARLAGLYAVEAEGGNANAPVPHDKHPQRVDHERTHEDGYHKHGETRERSALPTRAAQMTAGQMKLVMDGVLDAFQQPQEFGAVPAWLSTDYHTNGVMVGYPILQAQATPLPQALPQAPPAPPERSPQPAPPARSPMF